MFQWDKSIRSMGVPVGELVHLYRSMRDVQLALPGLPAQEATAYLCQHRNPQGIGTVAAFHLHKSNQLAFYADSPVVVATGRADAVLEQALMFVESMGFLMTDLDIHLLNEGDRELLWSSLPLQKGIQEAENVPAPRPAPVKPASLRSEALTPSGPEPGPAARAPAPKSLSPQDGQVTAAVEPKKQDVSPVVSGHGEQTEVDDLLAAVEELRTRRPGVRTRKRPPSPEELDRRREDLRENLGRILASL